MRDHRDLLERGLQEFRVPELTYEAILQRRDQRRRNQRMAAAIVGAVAAALLIVGVLAGVRALDLSKGTTPSRPDQIPAMHNGPITTFGFTGGLRSLSLDGGWSQSLVRCEGSCTLVSSAAWSPNGKQVAFSATCAGGCATRGDPYHGVRVVDLATDRDRLLVSGELFSASLDWSPDGSRISFVADGHIYVIDADGSNRTRVDGTSGPVVTASWSPDGDRFAYASGGALFLIDVDGSDARQIVPSTTPGLFSPAWSPDGKEMAYRMGCDVWVATSDGLHLTRIAALRSVVSKARCGSDFGSSEELAWSPDGHQIAVFEDHSQDVVLIQADGSDIRILHQHQSKFRPFGIAWQPVR
jgi:Tol biopolymer transport system component